MYVVVPEPSTRTRDRYMDMLKSSDLPLGIADPAVHELLVAEATRQEHHLEMIAPGGPWSRTAQEQMCSR